MNRCRLNSVYPSKWQICKSIWQDIILTNNCAEFLTSIQGFEFTINLFSLFRFTNRLVFLFGPPSCPWGSSCRRDVTRGDAWRVNHFAFTQSVLLLNRNSDFDDKLKREMFDGMDKYFRKSILEQIYCFRIATRYK